MRDHWENCKGRERQAKANASEQSGQSTEKGPSERKRENNLRYWSSPLHHLCRRKLSYKLRALFAINTSFRAENNEFKKLLTSLRPGISIPDRKKATGPLLEAVYQKEKQDCQINQRQFCYSVVLNKRGGTYYCLGLKIRDPLSNYDTPW